MGSEIGSEMGTHCREIDFRMGLLTWHEKNRDRLSKDRLLL